MISRRQFLKIAGAGAGLSAFGAADALAIEPRFALMTKSWNVDHPGWPASAKPLRIGVMTDVHAVEPWMPTERIRFAVDRLNNEKPDIIVLLGDYVKALRAPYFTREIPIEEWAEALSDLSAPLGVYAVLGNHDWWSGQVPAIRRAFDRTDIRLLENLAVKLKHGSDGFWLAGLGDQLAYGAKGNDDLSGTLKRINNDDPIVLLAHEPYIFPRVPSRVTLTLSGHTHGGQVYIPFIGRPALARGYYGGGFADLDYGHIERGGRHLIISSGLGLSHLPVRFLVPPEIAIVTLSNA